MYARPDISAIVTSYKFHSYLRAAVQSLLQQETTFSFEIIVIDDASPDNDCEVLRDIDDPRLQVIRFEHNAGAAQAINHGFSVARGRYVARLDGDDFWYPQFFQKMLTTLENNGDVGLVYCDVAHIDAAGVVAANSRIARPNLPENADEFVALLHEHYLCAPGIIARREVWDQVLPWPERFKSGPGDWFMNLSIAAKHRIQFVPDFLCLYRVHSQSMHHQFIRDGSGERNMREILDHFLTQPVNAKRCGSVAKIYAKHYCGFAAGYFGAGMVSHARQAYLMAARFAPTLLLQRRHLFPFVGSLVGLKIYAAIKRTFGLTADASLRN
jgi:glycosyltransferase involved in cell wall biosynthesis